MNKYIAIILLTVSIFSFGTPAFADLAAYNDAWARGDYPAAVKELRLMADEGIVGAQFGLGLIYKKGKDKNGKGVAQDLEEAFRWFKLAAEQGDAQSQFHLARMYQDGQGTAQDFVYAYMWFDLATAGDARVRNLRDKLALKMTPTQIEKAQDMARECVTKEYKSC